LLTADRPQVYRGSGAPQTIEQVGLYSYYAKRTLDLSQVEQVPETFSLRESLHVNVCFSEPLIDKKTPVMNLQTKPAAFVERQSSVYSDDVPRFFKSVQEPLVVLSALRESVRGRVLEFAANLGAPVYAEAQSGLRECEKLQPLLLKAGESVLTVEFIAREFDGILRIGSVPTVRFWRDLDMRLTKMPVLSVSDVEFSGLGRALRTAAPFSDLFAAGVPPVKAKGELLAADAKRSAVLNKLFKTYAQSEPSYFRRLSEMIPSKDLVFVGNSLPIREWDLAADYARPHERVVANRGANGIDGVISTFFGISDATADNWLILGDLSALYDLNALSFAEPGKNLRIVVVNNNGGQIFMRMFNDKNFLNTHALNFSKWAEMFGFEYQRADLKRPLDIKGERVIIELCPSADETDKFWREYAEVCK
jgi:2-succinyl-5-enolpyruvyl-6-hydroxy-3-cyclohexene-1-carboxylate synthase